MDKETLIQEIIREEYQKRRKGHFHEVEPGTGKVLMILDSAETEIHPTDLCEKLQVTMPRITIILNTLEKDGFVNRVIDRDDRRKIVVTITEKGRDVIKEKKNKNEERVRKMVNELGVEDMEAYLRVLRYMKTGFFDKI